MSYDIRLKGDDGRTVKVDGHQAGGIWSYGGNDFASCTITFNFTYFFENEIDGEQGLRWLHGKTAGNTIPVLERAIEALGTEPHQDTNSYWIPDPGNAGRDLDTLLAWAQEHPEATWEVM